MATCTVMKAGVMHNTVCIGCCCRQRMDDRYDDDDASTFHLVFMTKLSHVLCRKS